MLLYGVRAQVYRNIRVNWRRPTPKNSFNARASSDHLLRAPWKRDHYRRLNRRLFSFSHTGGRRRDAAAFSKEFRFSDYADNHGSLRSLDAERVAFHGEFGARHVCSFTHKSLCADLVCLLFWCRRMMHTWKCVRVYYKSGILFQVYSFSKALWNSCV
jgi:hypothetical protein